MFPTARPLLASVLITTGACAMAQSAAPAGEPAPSAAALELTYRSTFDGYQRFADEKVGSWREANDTVGRIGGWRAYAKEASEPAKPAGAAPGAAAIGTTPASAADPHTGHGKQ